MTPSPEQKSLSLSATATTTITRNNTKRVHLNHAGASPPPQRVTDRVLQHLQLEQDLGGYAAQDAAQTSLKQVYQTIAQLIGAHPSSHHQEIALTESATVGWTRAFYAMVQQEERLQNKNNTITISTSNNSEKVILMSEAEYAASVVAACQWARDHSPTWIVLAIPSTTLPNGESTGIVDLEVLEQMLSGKYQYKESNTGEAVMLDPSSIVMICITHIPTNSGIVNPVEKIGEQIAAYNQNNIQSSRRIRYLVDACQSIGQMDVNVNKIKCDALVATGRKYLRAPRGTGFMYISSSLLEEGIVPSHVDHYGCPLAFVPTAYKDGVQLQKDSVLSFEPLPTAQRFEFWESNVANRLGLGEAVSYAMQIGLESIQQTIFERSKLLRGNLSKIPNVQIHHKDTSKCGIVTFQCQNVESKVVQAAMWEKGFELSVVPATSTPMDSSKSNVPDLVRASVTYTNTDDEILSFCASLEEWIGRAFRSKITLNTT